MCKIRCHEMCASTEDRETQCKHFLLVFLFNLTLSMFTNTSASVTLGRHESYTCGERASARGDRARCR